MESSAIPSKCDQIKSFCRVQYDLFLTIKSWSVIPTTMERNDDDMAFTKTWLTEFLVLKRRDDDFCQCVWQSSVLQQHQYIMDMNT